MIKRLLIITTIFLTGCTSMTRKEKMLFSGVIAAHSLDALSTARHVRAGGRELNPILGDYPNNEGIILFKGAVIGGYYLLGDIFPNDREGIYTIGIITGLVPAAYNQYLWDHDKRKQESYHEVRDVREDPKHKTGPSRYRNLCSPSDREWPLAYSGSRWNVHAH